VLVLLKVAPVTFTLNEYMMQNCKSSVNLLKSFHLNTEYFVVRSVMESISSLSCRNRNSNIDSSLLSSCRTKNYQIKFYVVNGVVFRD